MTDKQTRRKGHEAAMGGCSCRFYMLNPKAGSDAKAIARGLIDFREVEEVYVTEGSHGFVVKAKNDGEKEPYAVRSYIARKTGSGFREVVAYYTYKKKC